MSTKTLFIDNDVASEQPSEVVCYAERIIDFSQTDQDVSAADVVQVLKIPAGAIVQEVCTRVITAEGATCTAAVGDADGANYWDASVNLNATAGTMTKSAPGTDTYATTGKYYENADTIDLTMGHDTDTAVIAVSASYIMASKLDERVVST